MEQELYDPWEKEILGRRFIGHSDAVWNLDIRGEELLSTSADGTIKLWNLGSAEVKASHENEKFGIPISAQFTAEENKIVTGWTGEKLTVVDLETGTILSQAFAEKINKTWEIPCWVVYAGNLITG